VSFRRRAAPRQASREVLAAEKPNIILIIADIRSHGTIRAQGHTDAPVKPLTQNLLHPVPQPLLLCPEASRLGPTPLRLGRAALRQSTKHFYLGPDPLRQSTKHFYLGPDPLRQSTKHFCTRSRPLAAEYKTLLPLPRHLAAEYKTLLPLPRHLAAEYKTLLYSAGRACGLIQRRSARPEKARIQGLCGGRST
jgi:hypothetical protein